MKSLIDNFTFIAELSTLGFVEVDKPVLAYDPLIKQVAYTFIGRNSQNMEYIVEIRLKATNTYSVDKVYVYTPQEILRTPIVYAPYSITVLAGEEFSLPVAAESTSMYSTSNNHLTGNVEKYNSFSSNVAYLDTLNIINNNTAH